ncbi:MAG: terpene cyclase/mutase family protein [Deltaproteobacteria bacterium]|nr:terpene cyclase/mutase family protein [Deltaproteobacteria bacterium]
MSPRRIAAMLSLVTLLAASGRAAARDDAPTRAQTAGAVERALAWIAAEAYHFNHGFYTHWDREFWIWDTAVTIGLFDWLEANGWTIDAYRVRVENARAWLASVRRADGSFTYSTPNNPNTCNETTPTAALAVPSKKTDAWIRGAQKPDGHWDVNLPGLSQQDYPSVTALNLYAASCRGADVNFAAAYAWFGAQEIEPVRNYYSTRFYALFALAAVSSARDDFPDSLRASMTATVLKYADRGGAFEGRTMTDHPSAALSTALALQTALWLDDPELRAVAGRAEEFLVRAQAGDGSFPGGRYSETSTKDETLFTTVNAARALALALLRAEGRTPASCP